MSLTFETGNLKNKTPNFKFGTARSEIKELYTDPATAAIVRIYEGNSGPLIPLHAEQIDDALDRFPTSWIEEVIHVAVQYNKRSWV